MKFITKDIASFVWLLATVSAALEPPSTPNTDSIDTTKTPAITIAPHTTLLTRASTASESTTFLCVTAFDTPRLHTTRTSTATDGLMALDHIQVLLELEGTIITDSAFISYQQHMASHNSASSTTTAAVTPRHIIHKDRAMERVEDSAIHHDVGPPPSKETQLPKRDFHIKLPRTDTQIWSTIVIGIPPHTYWAHSASASDSALDPGHNPISTGAENTGTQTTREWSIIITGIPASTFWAYSASARDSEVYLGSLSTNSGMDRISATQLPNSKRHYHARIRNE